MDAYDIARQYSIETERFDRTVCTGPLLRGSIIPSAPHEHASINRNAGQVAKKWRHEADRLGISWNDVKRAMQVYEGTQQYINDMEQLGPFNAPMPAGRR